MAEETTTPRSPKRRWIGVTVGVVSLALFIGAAAYLNSASFVDLVRRRLIVALEGATGGRVEMASFRWNLSQLTVEATDLTVHGLEPAGELPYAHVDRAFVRLRVISFFQKRFTVERLELQHPVIHIIVNPDGSTNAPEPAVKSTTDSVQLLFELAIARADLNNGMALINERRLPLDFSANDITAQMTYDHTAKRYDTSVQAGKIDLQYADFRDIPARAEVQFSLWRNHAEIKSLKLTSQRSTLEASGKITSFAQPEIQLTYTSNVDVAQLGAVVRTPQLRGGTITLDGSAETTQPANYKTNGKLAIRDLDYVNDGISLRRTNLKSDYALHDNNLDLTRIAARALGGEITGSATFKNLTGSSNASPKQEAAAVGPSAKRPRTEPPASNGEQQGFARLRLNGVSLTELARTLSSRSLPLDKLKPAGTVNGTVNLDWRQSLANATAELAVDIAAPSRPAPDQLPLNGTLRGRYNVRSERLDLAALNLTTPRSQIEAEGSLGTTTASLNLKATTSNLAELEPLMSSGTPLPIELAGQASFDGTLRGRLRSPDIAGHVQATDFTYLYTPPLPAAPPTAKAQPKRKWFQLASSPPPPAAPPQPAAQPRRIHIDEFQGDIQYSQRDVVLHHGMVREGGAQLTVDGSASLERGNFTPNSLFQLEAALHNADVTELQKAAGTSYPVQGKLTLTLHAAGSAENPHGLGQFSLAQAEVRGRSLKALTSKFTFADHAVQLQDIHLQAPRGSIAGTAGYNFRTREAKLDLTGHSIELADLPELQSEKLRVEGTANFTIKGSGTLEQPNASAHIELSHLVLNDESIGTVTAEAVTQGRQLTLTARSNFPRASLTLDGNVELEGDMPANATLRFAQLNVNPFLPARVRKQVTRQASLDGQAQLSGPLKHPRLLHGTVNVQQFSVEVQHVPVRSDGPVQLSFANEVLTIERWVMTSEDTRVSVTGTLGLQGTRALDLRANGSLNLVLAQTLDPDLTSYGNADVNLNVRGTVEHPVLAGKVAISHAGVSTIDLPLGLGDLDGTMVFNQDRLEVEKLTGRMGGGRVTLGGFVTFGSTLGFNMTLEGNDVRLRYAGISATSDQSLRLTGTLQNSSVTGNITITRFAQIPSSDLQLLLSQATSAPSIPNPRSPLNNIHLEVRVLSTPELTVETSLAKLAGDVDLRVRGTAARPVLLGRISIAEGDIKLAGTKYHLERGDVTFINPVRIDPVLDVEATTRVRDYDITIGLHGTVERLNTTYRSDPPLSTDDIISLIAFGRTQTESQLGSNAGGPGFGESASGALLSSALNQAVSNRVSKIFGYSTIRINPSLGGPENDPNARLTLEQQVSNDITFTYITNLARSAQQVIEFEYNITREYTIQGVRDENGVVSFDLLIRKRRR